MARRRQVEGAGLDEPMPAIPPLGAPAEVVRQWEVDCLAWGERNGVEPIGVLQARVKAKRDNWGSRPGVD